MLYNYNNFQPILATLVSAQCFTYGLYVDVSMTSVRHRTLLLLLIFHYIFLWYAIITMSADSGNLGFCSVFYIYVFVCGCIHD